VYNVNWYIHVKQSVQSCMLKNVLPVRRAVHAAVMRSEASVLCLDRHLALSVKADICSFIVFCSHNKRQWLNDITEYTSIKLPEVVHLAEDRVRYIAVSAL